MSSQVVDQRLPTWTLTDRLRKARELTGMEKGEFASALGVTRNTIGNYEAGKFEPQKPLLRAWASLCGVSFEWLIGTQPADYVALRCRILQAA